LIILNEYKCENEENIVKLIMIVELFNGGNHSFVI